MNTNANTSVIRAFSIKELFAGVIAGTIAKDDAIEVLAARVAKEPDSAKARRSASAIERLQANAVTDADEDAKACFADAKPSEEDRAKVKAAKAAANRISKAQARKPAATGVKPSTTFAHVDKRLGAIEGTLGKLTAILEKLAA